MTNPDNPPKRKKPKKLDWDWRDRIVDRLMELGVAQYYATLAVIDFRPHLEISATAKHTPEMAAQVLLMECVRIYNKGKQYTPLV